MVVNVKNIKLLLQCAALFLFFLAQPCRAQFMDEAQAKVMAMNEIVQDPDKQVGNFDPDEMPSLPIGLNRPIMGVNYIIAIDSAYFLEDGAYFSAYMAIDFPGASQKIAFAAKDIKFNPKGIIGGEQSRLQLVSKHIIEIGPNTKLMLPSDGSNYVKWSCNGFESVNLHGFFIFEGDMIRPPENSVDTAVTAEFSVNVTDMHNMMTSVNFSPFTVKGMDNYNFTISEAYVDMSDFQNPYQVTLPQCYQETYSSDINLWRGFYLKLFSVQLPEELNKNNNAVTIYGSNMFIDDAGVTGNFGALNLFSLNEGKIVGDWGFSVDLLEVGLTTNQLTSGKLNGKMKVPPLDNQTLVYNAHIFQNPTAGQVDYNFSINPESNVSMSCFNSTLTVFPSSRIEMSRVARKFKPYLILNGTWVLDHSNWSLSGLGFQDFTLTTQAPYVTNGLFSLLSNEPPTAVNFPVSITNIGFGIINQKPVFGADIMLSFGDENDPSSFSAATSVKVYMKIIQNLETLKNEWKYDSFGVNTIYLAVNTNPFTLNGMINFNDNDPTYGKGFYGGLSLEIKNVTDGPMSMACAFGRVNGYRYWMVDATLPITIPMGSVTITSVTGGIAYHMKNQRTATDLIASASNVQSANTNMSLDYVPDNTTSLFFKAGVGFRNSLKEETLNGDVVFTVSFNQYGGLQNIGLAGEAYMMCKRSERLTSTNYAKGAVSIAYDNQEKIFDANLSMGATFSGAITATIWSKVYFSPSLWYVHLGKPSNQCSVNILNLATANAYFMIGQSLEAMPPPPPQVSSVIGGMSNQRNVGAIVLGDGIATGMNFQAGFDKSLYITDKIYIYGSGSAGAGFDMTLYKYSSTTHCEGSTAPFGMNRWYLQGQLYAYAGLNIGVTNDNWNYTILQGNLAVLLQGKMPKPSYVYGGVYVQLAVLGLFDIARTFDFEFGENCTIVQ